MENPDAYRAGKDLVEVEWRQNHRNYYSSFSLRFYQENDMPLLTGWFPSQSGGDEIRESQTDAFSNPIPWQLTWVQWFALQNVLAESDLPAYRKPSSDSYDEVDSEIRIVWRTDDGDEAQTLSGSYAEALEALVLGIAEEAYAASKLETEQREVRETAELVEIYWEQNASFARDCFSFLLDERTLPSRAEKQMLFSYRYQDGDGKPIFRKNAAVEPEKAQAYFSSIGQELRALELPVYPGACPDGVVDSYYKWISKDDDSHFIYVNFKENESGVYTVSAYNTSGFSGTEAIEKYLDIVKAEAAEANKAASANAEMKDFSVEIAQFAKDDVKVKIMTKIPVSGWSFDDSGRCLVENDDPTAFGAGAIRFEVRTNVEDFDYYKDKFENYQDIEDRVIGGITFRGRTYKYIGYNWIQYVAQIDDDRALSIGLTKLECVPGTMPDIILTNMTFQ